MELTDKQKLEVLDRTVKTFEGKCHRCNGSLWESVTDGDICILTCIDCRKKEEGDTFGEAYMLFCISK